MNDTTTAAEKAAPAPRSLLERRKQKTITDLLKRRRAACDYITKADAKHAEKVAPYQSEIAAVTASLRAEGVDLGDYGDVVCEACTTVDPVVGQDVEGMYLCQVCLDGCKADTAALSTAEGEGMTAPRADDQDESGKLQHAYTRGA